MHGMHLIRDDFRNLESENLLNLLDKLMCLGAVFVFFFGGVALRQDAKPQRILKKEENNLMRGIINVH